MPKGVYERKGKSTDGESTPATKKVIPSGSNVVGTENDARLKLYDSIADRVEENRAADMADIGEPEVEDEDQDEHETDSTPSPDQETERAEPADVDDPDADQVDKSASAPVEAKKHRLKVNGKELEFTEQELIERASKVEAADQYLAEAAKVYKQAKQTVQPSQDAAPKVEEDDLALARAIQMGSEEEAVNAIRKLRKSPSFNQDDLAKLVDERLTFQNAANQFKSKYSEIVKDPYLMDLVLREDERLIKEGDQRSYLERYDAIGEAITKWVGGFKASTVKADKQARKESVTAIKPASVRAQAAPDEEPDDSPQSVIATMAKARGQRI